MHTNVEGLTGSPFGSLEDRSIELYDRYWNYILYDLSYKDPKVNLITSLH